MNDKEILNLWKSGLSKYQVAKRYMQIYNQDVKIIRYDRRHRHEQFMTYYEALRKVEKIILEDIREK